MDLLRDVHAARHTTMVLVTHDAELAALADARLVLRDGAGRGPNPPPDPRRRSRAMRFVLRMAVRETRASWQRLLFFFVCIAVGVAAIVALRSVIQSVRGVLRQRGEGADRRRRADSTNRDWTPEARETIDQRLRRAGVTGRDRDDRDADDVRPADRAGGRPDGGAARGAAGFPLYGTLDARQAATYSHALLGTTASSSGRNC